jgi:DNA polymerase-3 subunit beta
MTATKTKTLSFTANVKGLQAALAAAGPVVPARTPKPILQNVLLCVDPEQGTTLEATDLEVGVRVRVLGVAADGPCRVVLPPGRLNPILASADQKKVEALSFEVGEDSVTIRGPGLRFTLPLEDPDLFPAVPRFEADAYFEVGAGDLKALIRRTAFATDAESTRYALGGVLFEFGGGALCGVATDGRRLALQRCAAEPVGDPGSPGTPVLPLKALKILDRVNDPADPPAHLAFLKDKDGLPNAAVVRTERSEVYTRLVQGRFPRYEDVLASVAGASRRASVTAGQLLLGVQAAAITTSDDSRGVDCSFDAGELVLKAESADVGQGEAVVPLDHYEGQPLEITFDVRLLADALKVLAPDTDLTLELVDAKTPMLLRTGDGYRYLAMPLTRH